MNPATTDRVLKYGHRSIPYRLQLSQSKRLRIVVMPTMEVRAYAPARCSEADILKAIQSKAPWIARQLDTVEQFHPLPSPHQYISGETFVYLGRQYRLRVEAGEAAPAKLRGRFLHVHVPDKTDACAVRRRVDTWYRERAAETFARYLDKWLVVGARHGIPEPQLVIRRMRTRWGSCTTAGRITLNVALVQTPAHCIEYVIMHELGHLKHHNHSKAFYGLLARCMPDWKRRKRVLDAIILADLTEPRQGRAAQSRSAQDIGPRWPRLTAGAAPSIM
ncbi:MAG: M48 family metallopeptidase [Candidatus Marinimicrobia bacterium]|nr:M48 family metallopeptidase [Candidatus Neomarinimicrobiota bacterium]